MFQPYFARLEKHLIKIYQAQGKKTAKKSAKSAKTAKKSTEKSLVKASSKGDGDYDDLIKAINGMLPEGNIITRSKICDSSDISVDTADFVVAEKRFKGMELIFPDEIPVELIRGSFAVCKTINRKQLVDTLINVANCKKVGQYEKKNEPPFHASFVIAFDSTYKMDELKKAIKEIYSENSVDPRFEFDLMIILGKGIVIKDWSSKGNYIALDTGEDSLMWFYIIMNEYLSLTTSQEFDLRNYIRNPKVYDEF
ncbi:MAG: hypothetical protein PF637_04340 [Spirochaetes bacterium]|jgi:hypothetical protein|nr:hypothetical protein [Spirochaetota bacterium]